MTDKTGKIYFASDLHLGTPDYFSSREREKIFVSWLDFIKCDATELYLLGDIFDFWFEYKSVIPKGYSRLLGKLAELSDAGIKIHIFKGNHDLWMRDYFTKEFNAEIYSQPIVKSYNGKTFYLAHGDGLGPGDIAYKMIKRIFSGRFNRFLFNWIHPDIGALMAHYFSDSSRKKHLFNSDKFVIENEAMAIHSLKILEKQHIDYFIFGHRHVPVFHQLTPDSTFVLLGDMFVNYSYAVFDGNELALKFFDKTV